MIILHILIAFTSIGYAGYTFLRPTKLKFYSSYILVAGTLLSGTFLVVSNPSHLASACVTGLIYLGVVAFGLVNAYRKLVRLESA